ncbi:hypothetical protein F5Y15DRAFT_130707 [Xylariaceae sp. FL0016]|nr:hypothetical protein F5Y15DRAFT_130707 [Xylariaceae sp. FL0016]
MSADDSDFYGEDDVVMELKSRVRNFDVQTWWDQHKYANMQLKLQDHKQPHVALNTSRLHNPWAGVDYAWQLTETVDAFLDRIPPATTEQTAQNAWIWICNPYSSRKTKGEADNQLVRGGEDEAPEAEGADLRTLIQAGEERLHMASQFINPCKSSGQTQAFINRECRKAGADAAKDILGLARELRVTCGKWMLFCSVANVNDTWEVVAKATVNNELGIAAKVAPKSNVDNRLERLICVYTADFSNTKDVKRVADKMKQLGLARGITLYYKPDIFTYLGISSGNPWEMRASIYDTKTIFKE